MIEKLNSKIRPLLDIHERLKGQLVMYVLNLLQQYSQKTVIVKVSLHGEAVEYLRRISLKVATIKKPYESESHLPIYHSGFFVYAGNLEKKLRNVQHSTWNELVRDKAIRDTICFYSSPQAGDEIDVVNNPPLYTCRKFSEIIKLVGKNRKK